MLNTNPCSKMLNFHPFSISVYIVVKRKIFFSIPSENGVYMCIRPSNYNFHQSIPVKLYFHPVRDRSSGIISFGVEFPKSYMFMNLTHAILTLLLVSSPPCGKVIGAFFYSGFPRRPSPLLY